MANVTVIRTFNQSQLSEYLTNSSASTTYLSQSSASTSYASLSGAAFTGNISTSGRITSIAVPAFSVYALNLGTQSGNLTYNSTIHNNGGHMVPSTGLFTAPVAGYYYFSYHGFVDQGLAGNTTVTFQKNGSGIPSRIYNDENGTAYGPGISLSIVTYLAANDNVRVNITGAGMHGNDNSFFKGFLIG
jgi:hypothetical protein